MLPYFTKPLPNANVASGWGDPRPTDVGGYHYALDMPAETGTPIYSIQAGTVIDVDRLGMGSGGKYVVIQQGQVASRYLHMSEVLAEVGQVVYAGEQIGKVGETGLAAGPHLHLDVFLGPDLLAEYKQRYGTPTPTFPAPRGTWGTQVPAEPLVPVDQYSDEVRKNAAARNVQLYEGMSPVAKVAIAAVIGYGLYRAIAA